MLTYMEEFDKVVRKGTIEEKRSFIRAFTKRVELDPEGDRGRAQLYLLPDLAAIGGESTRSSLSMVAGARYAPEKKTPRRTVEFEFGREQLSITATNPFHAVVTCLAA